MSNNEARSMRGKIRIEVPGRAWESFAAAPMMTPELLGLFKLSGNGTGSYWYAWIVPADADYIELALRWVHQQLKQRDQELARRCLRIADRIPIDIRVLHNDPVPG